MTAEKLNQSEITGLIKSDTKQLQTFFEKSQKRERFWNSTEKIIDDITKIDKAKIESLQHTASDSFTAILNDKLYTEIAKDTPEYRILHALASLHYALGTPDSKYGLVKKGKITHKLAQENVDAYCTDKLCGAVPKITETPETKAQKDLVEFKKQRPADTESDITKWESYSKLITAKMVEKETSAALEILLDEEGKNVDAKIVELKKAATETPETKAQKDLVEFKKQRPADTESDITKWESYHVKITNKLKEATIPPEFKILLEKEGKDVDVKISELNEKKNNKLLDDMTVGQILKVIDGNRIQSRDIDALFAEFAKNKLSTRQSIQVISKIMKRKDKKESLKSIKDFYDNKNFVGFESVAPYKGLQTRDVQLIIQKLAGSVVEEKISLNRSSGKLSFATGDDLKNKGIDSWYTEDSYQAMGSDGKLYFILEGDSQKHPSEL